MDNFNYTEGKLSNPSHQYTYVDAPIISEKEAKGGVKDKIMNINNIHIGNFQNFGYYREGQYLKTNFNIYFKEFIESLQYYFIDIYYRILELRSILGTYSSSGLGNLSEMTYTGPESSDLSANYASTLSPIVSVNNNQNVTYLDLVNMGTISNFGVNISGLNNTNNDNANKVSLPIVPNPIQTWDDFFKSINNHMLVFYGCINDLDAGYRSRT